MNQIKIEALNDLTDDEIISLLGAAQSMTSLVKNISLDDRQAEEIKNLNNAVKKLHRSLGIK